MAEGLKWTKGGVLSATQLNKIEGGKGSTDTSEIFWVEYNITPISEIENALSKKQIPMLKFINFDETIYAPLATIGEDPINLNTVCYFTAVSGNAYFEFKAAGNTWSFENRRIVLYTPQSLSAEQKAQARTNIGAAAATDIPTDEHINELIAAYINNN